MKVSDKRRLEYEDTARAALKGSRFVERASGWPSVLVFADDERATIYVDVTNGAVEIVAPNRAPRFITLGSGLLDAVERMLEQ